MHRRARHLNPGSAGAVMALDSRFITGLSDGDSVQTWTDRSASGNNAAQSTAGKQPAYKTAIQGGQPSVRFDGSNDILTSQLGVSAGSENGFACAVVKIITAASGAYVEQFNGFRWVLWKQVSGGLLIRYYPNTLDTGISISAGTTYLHTATRSGTSVSASVNGASTNTFSASTFNSNGGANSLFIGGSSSGLSEFSNIDLFSLVFVLNGYSNSLRRRIEHAAAFAFKVPCS